MYNNSDTKIKAIYEGSWISDNNSSEPWLGGRKQNRLLLQTEPWDMYSIPLTITINGEKKNVIGYFYVANEYAFNRWKNLGAFSGLTNGMIAELTSYYCDGRGKDQLHILDCEPHDNSTKVVNVWYKLTPEALKGISEKCDIYFLSPIETLKFCITLDGNINMHRCYRQTENSKTYQVLEDESK